MPPHCDSLDGPVVQAAARALDQGRIELVLPFVGADGESELRSAFEKTLQARSVGVEAKDVADRWFYETAVRVHRAGEGAPFTGLKPAGLDVGPVIPIAEGAIHTGDPAPLVDFLVETLRDQILLRYRTMQSARLVADGDGGVTAERVYVDAMLGLEVWSHRLYKQMLGSPRSSE